MIPIIGGDFTRSWLSLPLSHSTKAKGQKNILVIPHSFMEIPKCLLSAPDLRAAPCKNEAQQRQDHTWYKHPGSFVDDEPEPGSFCDPFPKMVATDLWHFKTCQSMPWKLCFHLAQQESWNNLEHWNNLEQLGTIWNNLEQLGTTQKHLPHVPTLFQRVLNFARESKNESFKKPSTNLQPELSRLAEPNLPMSCLLWKVTPRQSLPPTAKGSGKIAKHCCKKNTNLPSSPQEFLTSVFCQYSWVPH